MNSTKNATLTTVYILVNISLKAGWRQCCLKQTGPGTMAEKAYTSLLEDNPLDQVNSLNLIGEKLGEELSSIKRRVAMVKAQGNISGTIEWLNKYLEIFMADHDAWRELAEIYLSKNIILT
ncbi:unnamed protein product [Trifolium pratense]|uniref:Uncharacterized protein n=1 Tax=Trifolium pratense TaxID=57577 RepID=A0ACB0IL33_TRIPR|nr:unnamed protein product [Trifolium pratense]